MTQRGPDIAPPVSTSGGRGLCDHYETGTQPPADCEDCVCADCGEWRPSREVSQCGGLCRKCLDASLDEVDA